MSSLSNARITKYGRWLRLCLFGSCIVAASVWWTVRQAAADFSERSLSLGRQLDTMSELAEGATTIELNGERMLVTSLTRATPVKDLLDKFASLCGRDSGGVAEQSEELLAKGAHVPALLQRGAFGVFRSELDTFDGTAACFARAQGGGLTETIARIEKVLDTGDFAALGQLRYIFARRTADEQTHVITVSSLGRLRLHRMFSEGDAPGEDIIEGVRPSASRRLLSVKVEGSAIQTAMYESELPPIEALEAYDAPMRKRGFLPGDLSAVAYSLVAETRVFMRQDQMVLVMANQLRGKTAVSAFRLPGGGFVSAAP
jgi:hypothetical protein